MPVEKKRKKVKIDGPDDLLKGLKTFNASLEDLPHSIIVMFDRVFGVADEVPQKGVDMICEWAAWFINYHVEQGRQSIVKSLHEQNSLVNKVLGPIRTVQKVVTDPIGALGAVVSAIKSIANIFIGPIVTFVNFMIELTKELLKTAKNIAKLAEVLPPTPPNPEINFNKFKLDLGSIGIATVLEDPNNMPSPEEKFPEPIKPFSIAYFKALGNEAKTVYRKEKPFYTLPEEYSKLPTEDNPINPVDSENDYKRAIEAAEKLKEEYSKEPGD